MKKLVRVLAVAALALGSLFSSPALSVSMPLPAANWQGAASHAPNGLYLDQWLGNKGRIRAGSNILVDSKLNIPLINTGAVYAANPVTISQSGIQEFVYWKKQPSRTDGLTNARSAADWLIAQQAPDGSWAYDYAFSVGGMSETLPRGWRSAMAQGLAVSLLVRMWYSSGEVRYLSAAQRGLQPLSVDVTAGGLARTVFGSPVLEEYPTKTSPCAALNGWLYTLFGIYDLASTGFQPAQEMWVTQTDSVSRLLPLYDLGTISRYHLGDLVKPPRAPHTAAHYHRLHVIQLTLLNQLRANKVTSFYAQRWATMSV